MSVARSTMEEDTTSVDLTETVRTLPEDASVPVTKVTQFSQGTLVENAQVSYTC